MEKTDKKESQKNDQKVRLATLEDMKEIDFGIHGFEIKPEIGPDMAVFLLSTETGKDENPKTETMLYIANRFDADGEEKSAIDVFTIESAFKLWEKLGVLLFENMNKELREWQEAESR